MQYIVIQCNLFVVSSCKHTDGVQCHNNECQKLNYKNLLMQSKGIHVTDETVTSCVEDCFALNCTLNSFWVISQNEKDALRV